MNDLRERIQSMIDLINSGKYDNEAVHRDYDDLLEAFILSYDERLYPLIEELILLEKDFWYALKINLNVEAHQ